MYLTVNIPTDEFIQDWERIGEDYYQKGNLKGIVIYEDSQYVVLKLT